MRIAGRVMLAVLWLGLMCGLAGAFSGTPSPAPEGGGGFHKPLPAPPAIETAPAATATSHGDWSVHQSGITTGVFVSYRFYLALSMVDRVIAIVVETALYQRPPPHNLLA
jgi:hypothetical protein